MQLPERSTLAGGLSGLVAWGVGLGLTSLGITIPPTVITGVVAIIIPLIVHLVPDAAKVDAEIKIIAAELPKTYAEYPGVPTQKTPNNLS